MEPPSPLDPERGRRIKNLRKARGYTSNKALAEAMGVHSRSVDNWTRGRAIDGPNLARLAELLKVSPGYLWSGEEDDQSADPQTVLRDRVDRIEGRLAQEGRVVELGAHDRRVMRELEQLGREVERIREWLEVLAAAQRSAALAAPDLAAEVRELRAEVAALRQPAAADSQSAAGS